MVPSEQKKQYLLPGFHGVREALNRKNIQIAALWIGQDKKDDRTQELINIANARKIPIQFKKASQFFDKLPDVNHQGFVAVIDGYSYTELDDMVNAAIKNNTNALLLALDHITDEGNLGALIRTAAFFNIQGMILPKNRSAAISPTVIKRSSGGCMHLPITRVVNLGNTLKKLKKHGFWIIGASGESPASVYRFDWNRKVVLVLGNERKGLSKLVREQCDQELGIPAEGRLSSLNVAVAGGIIISEILRYQRPG